MSDLYPAGTVVRASNGIERRWMRVVRVLDARTCEFEPARWYHIAFAKLRAAWWRLRFRLRWL